MVTWGHLDVTMASSNDYKENDYYQPKRKYLKMAIHEPHPDLSDLFIDR